MKITITGASGFVGKNLSRFLKKDYELIPLSLRRNQNEKINLDSEVIIHLAGKAHDLKQTSEDKEYYEVNTELTKKVFDQFLKSSGKVFIFMSSVKAAADIVQGVLLEDVIADPMTVYGKSKLAAEKYILSKEIPENKRVYILRPCMIHGPGNKGNLNLLYKLVQMGIPYPLGKFKNKRSFLSIENLCFVIKELMLKRPESGVFNIADDTPISTIELIKIIAMAIGKKSKIWNIPIVVVTFFGKIGTWCKLPFTEGALQKLTENYIVSNSKIKEVLHVELPISTITGLINTIKSFNNK